VSMVTKETWAEVTNSMMDQCSSIAIRLIIELEKLPSVLVHSKGWNHLSKVHDHSSSSFWVPKSMGLMVCLLIHWLTFLFWTNNFFFKNWPWRNNVNLQCNFLLMVTQQPRCGKGLDLAEFWCIAFLNDLHWWNFVWWWCLAMWKMNTPSPTCLLWIKTLESANYTLGPYGPYVCSWFYTIEIFPFYMAILDWNE
jgi:hypothetical protein